MNGNSFSLRMPCQMGPGPKQALCDSLRELGEDLGGTPGGVTAHPRATNTAAVQSQDAAFVPTADPASPG